MEEDLCFYSFIPKARKRISYGPHRPLNPYPYHLDMKYACLVYMEADTLRSVPDAECADFGQSLDEDGKRLGGEALQPVETAVTVRVREGQTSVTDGPFAETKEQLAGFYLIDAADREEAVEIASRIPPARVGSIEVRPVRELEV